MNQQPVLKVDNLIRLVNQTGDRNLPLSEITFQVFPGRVTALTGTSEVGTSAVMSTVYNSYIPWTGRIIYHASDGNKINLSLISDSRMSLLRRQEISYVGPHNSSVPSDTAVQYVAKGLVTKNFNIDHDLALDKAEDMLDLLNVSQQERRSPVKKLPIDVRKRVKLARAAIIQPRLLILDEPDDQLSEDEFSAIGKLIALLKLKRTGILLACKHRKLMEQLSDMVVKLPEAVTA